LDYDVTILKLANALGGIEDVGQKDVLNPLGDIGSMKKRNKTVVKPVVIKRI